MPTLKKQKQKITPRIGIKSQISKPEIPKYRYFNNIMRNLDEIKISWGLSSRFNQLRTTKIHTKLNELIELIKR